MLRAYRLDKMFANGTTALRGVSLNVREGEILAVIGGSGCGKSTLLRLLSGLEPASSGHIFLDDSRIAGPRGDIGIIFQEPRLMPWLKVRDNVQFGLHDLPAEERRSRAQETLARVGLSHAADLWPRELSGGMAQRAAIARALVRRPKVLLLDEPFSALDAFTRRDLQQHMLDIWAYDRPTMVLVTHDIDEAMILADRVVVMGGPPGTIRADITVSLPRPRQVGGPAFEALKRHLLEALNADVDRRRRLSA